MNKGLNHMMNIFLIKYLDVLKILAVSKRISKLLKAGIMEFVKRYGKGKCKFKHKISKRCEKHLFNLT